MRSPVVQFQDALLHAVSGSREQKVSGSLELIRNATGFDALVLSSNDKHSRPIVGAIGHKPQTASFLASDQFESCSVLRTLDDSPTRLLAWEDVNFGESPYAREVLIPSGFRNGVSVPVMEPGSPRVGMLHCSIATPFFDRSIFALLLELRPVLGYLITLTGATQLPVQLSDREREILALIAEGKTNPEIAEDLYLSRSTVATHIERILRKIQVSNRTQAAIWWDRHGSAVRVG